MGLEGRRMLKGRELLGDTIHVTGGEVNNKVGRLEAGLERST
jgi:hypothetical protein